MIVVTGATGALNGATVDHLLEHVRPGDIAVVTRDPAKAARFVGRGVPVRVGDYADPTSLPAAFEGADQLLLVSSNDPAGDHVHLHRNAIEAAVAAGVGRVLYTSHQGAAPDTPFGPGRSHAATEDLLAASGLAWTSLRNGFYAHSVAWLMGPWQRTGTVQVPTDGPVSWTAREDAAQAAAAVLLSPRSQSGPITLTAASTASFADLAAMAGELSGRHVGFEVFEPQEWVAQREAGDAQSRARFMLGMFQAAEQGFFAGTDPLLGDLLGRDPRPVRDAVAACL